MKLRSGKIIPSGSAVVYKKRAYKKKITTKKGVDKEIHKVLNKMAIYSPEKKYLVTTGTVAPTTGSFVSLAVVAQGDTSITRHGNDIRVTKIELVYSIQTGQNAAAVNYEQSANIGLLIDKEPAGAFPGGLFNTNVSAGPSNVFLGDGLTTYIHHPLSKQQYRYGPSNNFHYAITDNTSVWIYSKPQYIQWNFPNGLDVEYSSTTGVLAESVKNWPLLYMNSYTNTALANTSTVFTYRVLLTYTDA